MINADDARDRRAFYGEDALAVQLTAAIQDAIEHFAAQSATDDPSSPMTAVANESEPEPEPDESRSKVRWVVAPKSGYQASLGFDAEADGFKALLFSRAGLLELTIHPGGDPRGLRVVNPTMDVGPLVEAVFPHSVRRAPTLWDELGLRTKR